MITLLGHGYIGQAIHRELEDVQHIMNYNLNYSWLGHMDIIPYNTTCIINATGYTGVPNVDACEIYKQETIDGNVLYPLELEEQYPNIPIVHISSGCVYTGYKDNGWTEEDPPNFDFSNGSFYSGAKALEQMLLTPYMNKSYILRIRMPFGDKPDSKNLLTKLEKYDKLINYENSLSYINDVAKVAVFFAYSLPVPGIYNVCNPGSKTTMDIAKMLGLEKEWFTPDEFKAHVVAPRSNCVLNTDKLTAIYPMPSIDTILPTAIQKYRTQ